MSSTYEQNLQSESILMTGKNSVILNLNEKTKTKKIKFKYDLNKNNNSNQRKDAFGTIINHKNKTKIKVTFQDKLDENVILAEIIDVENYKEYNKLNTAIPLEDVYIKDETCCSNCNIF